jgi:drug/metabolite transporter (DMT)-like permease
MWASSGTAGRAIIDAGITPSDLVQIRVTIASAMLATFFLLMDRRLFRIELRDVGYLAFLGGVVMAAVQITYFYTISKIQVMAAILLEYLSPVLVAVFSILFWGERFAPSTLAAVALALSGCYLVVGGYNLELLRLNRLGILGGLAAAVSFAAYALLGERIMRRYRPWTVVFYAMLFAAVTWQVIHPPFKFIYAPYTEAQWGWILYIVVIGTVAPFGLYFVGINHIRSTRATITATLEPISAGFMAGFFLGQSLELPQIVGAALVVAAIVVLQIHREQDELTPEAIRGQIAGNRE